MTFFSNVNELEVLQVWEGVQGRAVAGREATLALIVLDPHAAVPEHRHPNEQTGLLLRGALDFTIGGESKTLGPGALWVIPGDTPHEVTAGPDGATLVELFAPPRDDWVSLERSAARPVTLA